MFSFDESRLPRQQPKVFLPPGQRLVTQIPEDDDELVPLLDRADWELTLTTEEGRHYRWDWSAFEALLSQRITLDLHCVAGWSVLDTTWDAVSVHQLFDGVPTAAEFVSIEAYGGQSTNLPVEDLLEIPTWLAFTLNGTPLTPTQGGPVRLLVPHLYLWKSLKWAHTFTLGNQDRPGTRERAGFHNYGDPWRQQRLRDD